LIAGATILGGVAIVGAFAPATAAGGSGSAHGAAPAAAAGASIVGADWGATGGFDVMDLITKGGLVLVLLFITLRVLGRMQSAAPKRGLQLQVLESRTLAAKASLHLVAVGERRLVVGLTPSGMVSLVELDAAELEAPETEARTAADSTASAKLTPQLAGPIGALMAPIDGFTDRLAGFFNSGRTR
jgi:flagellar biogenesis protein FliO